MTARRIVLVLLVSLAGVSCSDSSSPSSPTSSSSGGSSASSSSGSSSGSSSNSSGSSSAQLAIYTTQPSGWSSINVFVDGNFAGALTAYRTSKPACAGDASVVIYSTSTGSHSISAQSNTSITWTGNTTANQGCNTIELIDQSSSGTGNSGGSGGSSTGVGTVVSQCVSNVLRLGASQVNWVTMPSPFNGIDFKVYYLAGNGVYEVIWRNRYNDAIFFNFQPSVGTPATKTTYRDQLGSGHEESPPGVTVQGLNDGGTACMRVDQVRFGTDSGPYK